MHRSMVAADKNPVHGSLVQERRKQKIGKDRRCGRLRKERGKIPFHGLFSRLKGVQELTARATFQQRADGDVTAKRGGWGATGVSLLLSSLPFARKNDGRKFRACVSPPDCKKKKIPRHFSKGNMAERHRIFTLRHYMHDKG